MNSFPQYKGAEIPGFNYVTPDAMPTLASLPPFQFNGPTFSNMDQVKAALPIEEEKEEKEKPEDVEMPVVKHPLDSGQMFLIGNDPAAKIYLVVNKQGTKLRLGEALQPVAVVPEGGEISVALQRLSPEFTINVIATFHYEDQTEEVFVNQYGETDQSGIIVNENGLPVFRRQAPPGPSSDTILVGLPRPRITGIHVATYRSLASPLPIPPAWYGDKGVNLMQTGSVDKKFLAMAAAIQNARSTGSASEPYYLDPARIPNIRARLPRLSESWIEFVNP